MTLNLYTMPITSTVNAKGDTVRTAKYASTFAGFSAGMYDYGSEPACLVGILDIDTATDTALTAFTDCSGLPTNLNNTVGGARTTVQNNLEAVNIPGAWVLTTSTWREVVLFVGGCCQFAQRYQGQTGGQWFTGGVTLNTTFNTLSAGVRTAIQLAGNSDWVTSVGSIVHMDTSGFTGASTLRQIIRSAGSQYVSLGLPLMMAGVDLYTA